jgi:peptidyl-prolyl cis-trans isomerase SurA
MKAGRVILLGLLFATLAAPVRAETVSGIAAVVNDRVVTTHQLDQAVAAALEGKPEPGQMELANLRSQLLSRLIEDSLVEQKIAELGLKVSDEEVEAAIDDVQKQNQLTREQLVAALQAQGMDFADYKENLRKQILRFKLIGREVQSKVEVTNQDELDYFREHIDDYREAPYMRISRITFPVPANAAATEREAIRSKAEQARQRLVAGEELEAVLKAYTGEGAEGGDMGIFKEGELSKVFDQAIRNLQQDQVSELVDGPKGNLYLFKVDVRKPGSIRKFDTVKGEIEQTLLKQKREERFKEWAQGLRKAAYIDIRI